MSDDWTLYYWPGMPGRGEFIRLIFEEAGVKYSEINDADVLMTEIIQGQSDFYPQFAPPMIKRVHVCFITYPIINYMVYKFDLLPICMRSFRYGKLTKYT